MTLVIFFLVGGVVGTCIAALIDRAIDRRAAIARVGWWSAMRPAAHCDACRRPLRRLDATPVIGWLHLDGRARCCGAPIPVRHLIVETLGFVVGGIGVLGLLLLL
ncbi:prepilin peptidase [Algiphilus sp.]|uniref:prepilin peptidase n=1 Tax=Algiphilus sp. TaxID=1872431 RepID=UPI001CA7A2F8|nr:prepilin peptidase [Algiphilus sp.]MBY8966943.1 prepilin peptidase [Algiphilus acroporae]MCI5103559.1 prepilin peptidase [Algiphilus sp.]